MGKVSMYDTAEIARGGFGPAGTGHMPPPAGSGSRPERPPTFELIGKGLANGHAAADRIETVLDRIEPIEPEVDNGNAALPAAGHAQNVIMLLQHLVSRLHKLADRLESHG